VLGRQSCSSDIINEHHFHLELDETLPEPIRDAASSTIMNGSFLLLCFYFQEKKDAERKRPFIPDPSGSSCWRLVLLTGPIELAATSDVGGNSLRSILLLFLFPPFHPSVQHSCNFVSPSFRSNLLAVYDPPTVKRHERIVRPSSSFTFMIIDGRFISVLSNFINIFIRQVHQVLAVTAHRPKRFV